MSASARSSSFPRPVQGSLQLFQSEPISLPYVDTDVECPHSLVFIPGLGDTLASCPYMAKLADMLRSHRFSLVQPQLSSSLGGWGQSTLEGDAQEIAACIAHLRSTPAKKEGKVILMGHSTGCQDCVAYLLSSQRSSDPLTKLDGVILQAPVSDRESYEHQRANVSEEERAEMDDQLAQATRLVEDGNGAAIMPDKTKTKPQVTQPIDDDKTMLNASLSSRAVTDHGNSSYVLAPATSAYRHWSLYAKGGDDDFFSSDLSDSAIVADDPGTRSIGRAIRNLRTITSGSTSPQFLALMSEQDEYVQPGVGKAIVNRWQKLLGPTGSFQAKIVKGANHKVDNVEAQNELICLVDQYLSSMGM